MDRRATLRWQTPSPTWIDEELVLYADGTVLLAVRGSRSLGPTVGTYRCAPAEADLALLAAGGPEPVDLPVLVPPPGKEIAVLRAAADRVAASGASSPEATATFHARADPDAGGDGPLTVTLFVVGAGHRPVEFQLEPELCSVGFLVAGQGIGSTTLPPLPIGFVTPRAEGLGGLNERAVVAPGSYGAISFEVPPPASATAIVLTVAGWLSEALPDAPEPARFVARTGEATIGT